VEQNEIILGSIVFGCVKNRMEWYKPWWIWNPSSFSSS